MSVVLWSTVEKNKPRQRVRGKLRQRLWKIFARWYWIEIWRKWRRRPFGCCGVGSGSCVCRRPVAGGPWIRKEKKQLLGRVGQGDTADVERQHSAAGRTQTYSGILAPHFWICELAAVAEDCKLGSSFFHTCSFWAPGWRAEAPRPPPISSPGRPPECKRKAWPPEHFASFKPEHVLSTNISEAKASHAAKPHINRQESEPRPHGERKEDSSRVLQSTTTRRNLQATESLWCLLFM